MRPQANKHYKPSREAWSLRERSLDLYNPQARAVQADAAATVINIYGFIGEDFWTGTGNTAKGIADQIKGKGDLVININSPGGDFFEGMAIYELLRLHQGKKTVNIVSLAASAASIIAAAGAGDGNVIRIAPTAYVMIHKCWGLVVGTDDDFSKAAEAFAKFDQGARLVYVQQTGKADSEIADLMRAETYMLGQEAIDEGFADELLSDDATLEDSADPQAKKIEDTMTVRRAEALLCKVMTRKDARQFLKNFTGTTQDAGPEGKQDAAVLSAAADGLRGFLARLQKGN